MHNGKIIGVGEYKAPMLKDEEYVKILGKKAKAVSKVLPHNSRYTLIDLNSGSISITNTDMAYEAAQNAIKMANVDCNDIDMIIYSTCTPDYIIPACFSMLQEKLGIKNCKGFDIRSGCAGFGTAIVIAQQCIMTEMAHRVLVVGSELMSSRFSIYFNDIHSFPIKSIFNLMFFGDGAGAIILEATKEDNKGIFYAEMGSNKPEVGYGSIMKVGGSKCPYPNDSIPVDKWSMYQPSNLSDKYLPMVLIEAIEEFLEKTNMKLQDFDHYIFPVDTQNMADTIINHFRGFNVEKVITVSHEGGALANAAIPMSIYKGIKNNIMKPNEKVLIYAGENTKWQHAVIGLTL